MRYASGESETGQWRDGALDTAAPAPPATETPPTDTPPAEAAIDAVPNVEATTGEPAETGGN